MGTAPILNLLGSLVEILIFALVRMSKLSKHISMQLFLDNIPELLLDKYESQKFYI
jgi:hypothetical protein